MPLLCSCDWLDRTMVKLEVGMEVGVGAREEVGVAATEEVGVAARKVEEGLAAREEVGVAAREEVGVAAREEKKWQLAKVEQVDASIAQGSLC